MHSADHIMAQSIGRNGNFPNNDTLPLVLYKNVFQSSALRPEDFEELFTSNHWPAAWRNGLFDFHHFHSSSHEALGVYSGWVEGCFGGPGGENMKAEAGDVIVIPAGVSHCNLSQSIDFKVVGAYPKGQKYDLMRGKPGEFHRAYKNITSVPLPKADPITGDHEHLLKIWHTEDNK